MNPSVSGDSPGKTVAVEALRRRVTTSLSTLR